jgi:predicted transcriptional regulator
MNLQRVRVLLKLTQDELAQITGYSQSMISQMELKKRPINPEFETIMKKIIIKMRGKEARIQKMMRTGDITSAWPKGLKGYKQLTRNK